MGVYIKGMSMPRDCPMCPMAHYNKLDEFTGCEIVPGKKYEMMRPEYANSDCRPDWCPLIEVPDPDEDKAFRRGAEAAWEAARKIMTKGGFDYIELEEIFDYPDVSKDIGSILEKLDAITAMYKIADYERKKTDATHDIH